MEISSHGVNDFLVEDLSIRELEQAWARRAAQVAQSIEQDDQGEQIELAIIRLGRELYGLEVQYIFDIRPVENITRVPRVPDWVAGIVNLRGQVISVLDLRLFLDLPAKENNSNSDPSKAHLVEVEIPEMELALLADEVLAIEVTPVTKIQEATSAIRNIPQEYIRGIVVWNGGSTEGRTPGDGSNTNSDNDPASSGNGKMELGSKKNGKTSNGYSGKNHALNSKPAPANNNSNHFGGVSDSSNSLLVILNLPALLSDKRLVIHEEVL